MAQFCVLIAKTKRACPGSFTSKSMVKAAAESLSVKRFGITPFAQVGRSEAPLRASVSAVRNRLRRGVV